MITETYLQYIFGKSAIDSVGLWIKI